MSESLSCISMLRYRELKRPISSLPHIPLMGLALMGLCVRGLVSGFIKDDMSVSWLHKAVRHAFWSLEGLLNSNLLQSSPSVLAFKYCEWRLKHFQTEKGAPIPFILVQSLMCIRPDSPDGNHLAAEIKLYNSHYLRSTRRYNNK